MRQDIRRRHSSQDGPGGVKPARRALLRRRAEAVPGRRVLRRPQRRSISGSSWVLSVRGEGALYDAQNPWFFRTVWPGLRSPVGSRHRRRSGRRCRACCGRPRRRSRWGIAGRDGFGFAGGNEVEVDEERLAAETEVYLLRGPVALDRTRGNPDGRRLVAAVGLAQGEESLAFFRRLPVTDHDVAQRHSVAEAELRVGDACRGGAVDALRAGQAPLTALLRPAPSASTAEAAPGRSVPSAETQGLAPENPALAPVEESAKP
jgi:hypothetical protein